MTNQLGGTHCWPQQYWWHRYLYNKWLALINTSLKRKIAWADPKLNPANLLDMVQPCFPLIKIVYLLTDGEDDGRCIKCHIKELDDVLLRDVGDKIQLSGKYVPLCSGLITTTHLNISCTFTMFYGLFHVKVSLQEHFYLYLILLLNVEYLTFEDSVDWMYSESIATWTQ